MFAKWIETDGRFSFSLDDNGGCEITDEDHSALIVGNSQGRKIAKDVNGYPCLLPIPSPTQADLIAEYESALDAHLDSVAQSHRYRDRVTFALRAGYPGPYRPQGIAFGTWMDTCNAQSYALLAEVIAGTTPLPTQAAFIAGLPPFILP